MLVAEIKYVTLFLQIDWSELFTSCKHRLLLVSRCVTQEDAAAVSRPGHRFVLGKMAEVSGKLRSGVYRLSALRTAQSRSVFTGETGCEDNRELQTTLKVRATQRLPTKLTRVIKNQIGPENRSLFCSTRLDLDLCRFNGFVETMQTQRTVLYLSERLQPVLQEKLLPCRMTSWSRRAESFHPDAFRSLRQLRAFCTVILILAEQESERPVCGQRLTCVKLHHNPSTSRSYSCRSDSSSADAPLLHRTRTAYYDVLRVTPGATQSQIKTAYYKQSFIYHPDKNPGSKEATQRFSEISEAYTVLGNIGLRKKYDRGILSQSDVQTAGRPSSNEAASRPRGSPPQQPQQRAKFSQAGGRPRFDFDAFYQAHYGEQLQRERIMKAKKEHMEQHQKKIMGKWKEGKVIEATVMILLAMAGLLFINICKS